jgi:hypothetical protein
LIQRERSDIVSRRRYVDDSDDVSLFTGTSVPTLYSPVALSPPRPMDAVDEYGRTVQDPSDPRSSLRIARRSTREQRLAVRPNQDEEESAWTDDELEPSDSADLSDALRSLRESLEGLFADVKADDFRDPNLGIRAKFEQWREKFGDEYGNAYGGLAMVGVWEFWARVEMALWNPFEVSLHLEVRGPELMIIADRTDGQDRAWTRFLQVAQGSRIVWAYGRRGRRGGGRGVGGRQRVGRECRRSSTGEARERVVRSDESETDDEGTRTVGGGRVQRREVQSQVCRQSQLHLLVPRLD